MTLDKLLNLIETQADSINFDDVIQIIDNEYTYTPSRFSNGKGNDTVINESRTNEGSCKIFAFALLNHLTQQQTLACFGKYYRDDVLLHPHKNDHANIRTLMIYSLDNINFDNNVLVKN